MITQSDQKTQHRRNQVKTSQVLNKHSAGVKHPMFPIEQLDISCWETDQSQVESWDKQNTLNVVDRLYTAPQPYRPERRKIRQAMMVKELKKQREFLINSHRGKSEEGLDRFPNGLIFRKTPKKVPIIGCSSAVISLEEEPRAATPFLKPRKRYNIRSPISFISQTVPRPKYLNSTTVSCTYIDGSQEIQKGKSSKADTVIKGRRQHRRVHSSTDPIKVQTRQGRSLKSPNQKLEFKTISYQDYKKMNQKIVGVRFTRKNDFISSYLFTRIMSEQ